jgi:diadenosine tetraphosphate (Ap4A) HIT family hydrolase
MTFTLHPQLQADTARVAELGLCSLLLMNDARFPWCILVPRIAGAREVHTLRSEEQASLWAEVAHVAGVLEAAFDAHKINIAALGNLVPQLHVHVIARHANDAAWPSPVWGYGTPTPYSDDARAARLALLREAVTR